MNLRRWLLLLLICGCLARFYRLQSPWGLKDHYNFGGVWTTAYTECLKSTPLAESHGVPHTGCRVGNSPYGYETDAATSPHYYRAHSPVPLFALWGWTALWGSSHEWAYRLFPIFFSLINVALVFVFARRAFFSSVFPAAALLAATLQATSLGNVYFASHLDFIGEFTVTFVLLAGLLADRRQWFAACGVGLLAGLTSWPGFIVFAPLFALAVLRRKADGRPGLVVGMGILSFAIALGLMAWLHQSANIFEFLRMKLLSPGYVTERERSVLAPLYFLHASIRWICRLLGPGVLMAVLLRLWTWPQMSARARTSLRDAVIFCGGTGLVYAIIGHEYVMVHPYLFLLLTPGLLLLATSLFMDIWMGEKIFAIADQYPPLPSLLNRVNSHRAAKIVSFLLPVAIYPYGIYSSSLVHDVANSVFLISGAALLFAALSTSGDPQKRRQFLMACLVLTAIGNISQMMNYRNEPDTERAFCRKAAEQYFATHQIIVTDQPRSDAKDQLYCRGLPIEYGGAHP